MTSSDTKNALSAQLARLRSGLKKAILLEGITYALPFLAGTVLAAILIDYVLRLNVPGRMVISAAVLAVVIGRIARCVVIPFRTPLSDAHIARIAEQKNPGTGAHLLSVMQLREDDPAHSPELVRSAARRGADLAKTAKVVGPAFTRSMGRSAAILGGLIVFALALNAMSPYGMETLPLGLNRLLRPWDAGLPWPQRTRITLALEYGDRARDVTETVKVARGDTVKLIATEKGSLTRTARLHYDIAGLESGRRFMTYEGPGTFTLAVPNIIGDAELYVSAGDGVSNTVRLAAVERPRVKSIRVSIKPPAYSGQEEKAAEETGQIRALRGSMAKIVADANKAVQSCTAVLQKSGTRLTDITQVSPTRFVMNMLVREDDLYVIKLVDTDGFESARPEEYEIQGVMDQGPVIRIIEPDSDGAMLPSGAVTFKFEAKDDYGIRDIFVHVKVNDSPTPQYVLRLKGLEDSPKFFAQKVWAFDLSKVRPALNPGDRVTFQALAHDGREDLTGQIRESVEKLLPEVSEEAKTHMDQARRIAKAQTDALLKDPSHLTQIEDPELRERVRALAEAKAAAKLEAFIASHSKTVRDHRSAFEAMVEKECDRLVYPDRKEPALLAGRDLGALADTIRLKQVVGSGVSGSEILRMDMIDREELASMIAEQQAALGTIVEHAADLQGKNADRTNIVMQKIAKDANLRGFKSLIFDTQITQENVEAKITDAKDKYENLVKTVVQNGLDTSAVRKRIRLISDQFLDLAEKRLPGIRESLQDAKLADPADRNATVKQSFDLQVAAIAEMKDIVAKLRGWSDMEKLIIRARKVVDLQQAAGDSTSALASEFTGKTVEQMDDKARERLGSAASGQRGVRTETEILEDDLAKVAEKVKSAEVTMYLRVKRVLSYSRKEQLVDRMAQCSQFIARNQCVAAGALQKDILRVLKRMVQNLEAAVDPTKYDIEERGDGELPLEDDLAIWAELETILEPLIKEQREVLRLTRELDADSVKTSRFHLMKLDETETRQSKIARTITDGRRKLLEAVKPDEPGEKLNEVVVIPVVLSELAGTMKTIVKSLNKDDTGVETQEMELDCIGIMQDMMAAMKQETIVLDEVMVAQPVISGDGPRGLGAVQDVRLLQLMQVAVNAVTIRLDKRREGEKDFARLGERLQGRIKQLADRQLLIADLTSQIGELTKGPEDDPDVVIPLPSELMKKVGGAIRNGDTGKAIQKEQKNIVAMLQDIVRTIISQILAHSSLPDQLRDAAGGDEPEGEVDVTKPAPDLTHLLPGLKGKKSLEEMLMDMKKLEAWAQFTATEMEQIRMGRMGDFGGKYGELVKRYYITLAGGRDKPKKK